MLNRFVIPAYPQKGMSILAMPLSGKSDAKAEIQRLLFNFDLDSGFRRNDGF